MAESRNYFLKRVNLLAEGLLRKADFFLPFLGMHTFFSFCFASYFVCFITPVENVPMEKFGSLFGSQFEESQLRQSRATQPNYSHPKMCVEFLQDFARTFFDAVGSLTCASL